MYIMLTHYNYFAMVYITVCLPFTTHLMLRLPTFIAFYTLTLKIGQHMEFSHIHYAVTIIKGHICK